jgi:hypothetical protein
VIQVAKEVYQVVEALEIVWFGANPAIRYNLYLLKGGKRITTIRAKNKVSKKMQ